MFIPDMSSYSYSVDEPLVQVRAVGWLDDTQPYSKGILEQHIFEKFFEYYTKYKILVAYGHHACPFCLGNPVTEYINEREVALGSSEIWIPAQEKGIIFAAPDLILHYCKAHDYLPPKEFIDAIVALDTKEFSKEKLLDYLSEFPERVYHAAEFDLSMPMTEEEMLQLALRQKKRKNR